MAYTVGVTAGLHYIGRSPELSTPVRKLGFAITRGANMLQIDLDYGHEVTYTDGLAVRQIAKKQGMLLAVHGDLQLPVGIPERNDYRDCLDRMKKSLMASVFMGGIYVDFHASLNVWLELLTYTSSKLAAAFVDHKGRFISEILFEEPKLREWFVNRFADPGLVERNIFTAKDKQKERDVLLKRNNLKKKLEEINRRLIAVESRLAQLPEDSPEAKEFLKFRDSLGAEAKEIDNKLEKEDEDDIRKRILVEKLSSKSQKERGWDEEDVSGGLLQGHKIMFQYLFARKDPMFLAFGEQHKEMLKKLNLDYNNADWPDEALKDAEIANDREFKDFFYGVVTAKYLEGLLQNLMDWLENDLIKKEIPKFSKFVAGGKTPQQEEAELIGYAKKIILAIENPEARQVEHSGMHLLWKPQQIYAAVKTIRSVLKTERVWMIIDHEHISAQGLDAFIESRKIMESIKDFGSYVIAIHANHPNPLHLHDPVEFGDDKLYELFYNLRKTGFGKKSVGYIVYERGGAEDPYGRSVEALKISAELLEKDADPKKLPMAFYGLEGMTGDLDRQWAQILNHKMDPIKDLLEVSEEDWGIFSSQARQKGRAESFKKEEFK